MSRPRIQRDLYASNLRADIFQDVVLELQALQSKSQELDMDYYIHTIPS